MSERRSFKTSTMKSVEYLSFLSGKAAVYSCPKPVPKRSNEDAAALISFTKENGILVVADGVGGLPSGGQASNLAIDTFFEVLSEGEAQHRPLRETILNGFELANKKILEMGSGAASTLAVVEIEDNRVRPYHVGDSCILVIGQRGKLKWQSVAHSPVGYAQEAGLLTEEEAIEHEDRHLVSNILGSTDMHIEIGPPIKLAQRDTVVLATDGLFDNLHTDEIINTIRAGSLEKKSNQLVEIARNRMTEPKESLPSKPDDLTFITFRLK